MKKSKNIKNFFYIKTKVEKPKQNKKQIKKNFFENFWKFSKKQQKIIHINIMYNFFFKPLFLNNFFSKFCNFTLLKLLQFLIDFSKDCSKSFKKVMSTIWNDGILNFQKRKKLYIQKFLTIFEKKNKKIKILEARKILKNPQYKLFRIA